MALVRSTYKPALDLESLQFLRKFQSDKITPEAADLNAKLQQLPAYQQYVQDVLLGHNPPYGRSEQLVKQAGEVGIQIPDSLIFDPYTGQVREKIWNERNSGWSGLIYVGAAIAAGLTAGAALGAVAGGAASGVGIGETAATTGLASGAGLPGAVSLSALPTAVGTGTTLASTAIPSAGMTALPSVAASGEVAEALGTATPVLASTAIPAANMTELPTAAASGELGGTLGSGGAATLPSTQVGNGMIDSLPNVTPSGDVASALGTGGGILSKIYNNKDKIADTIGAIGSAVSGATKNAGDTQLQNLLLDQQARNSNISANNSNISGTSAAEDALQGRSKLESSERSRALANIYINSRTLNPSRSPFNPTAPTVNSPDYLNALSALSAQGAKQLSTPAAYGTGAMKPLVPYVPISTSYSPDTSQSGLQKAGNILAPSLGIAGALAKIYAASR